MTRKYLLLLLLLLIPSVSAIGISPAIQSLDFTPGKTITLAFTAIGATQIDTYLRGDLAQYAEIVDPAPGTGPRNFQVKLTIPANATPGPRQLLVGVIELPPPGVMVGGRAAYQSPVNVFVPYPGIYLESSLFSHDININDTEHARLELVNRGTQSVPVTVTIEIFDTQDASVGTKIFEPYILNGSASKEHTYDWNSTKHAPGPYFVKAIVISPNTILERKSSFNIGSLLLKILNFSKNGTVGIINPFIIEIKSEWNSPLSSVYASIKLNDTTFNTPSVDLQPAQQTTLKGYWDLTGASAGTYNADIKVIYGTSSSRASGQVIAFDRVTESPSSMITGTRLIIASILLVIALLILFLRRRKK